MTNNQLDNKIAKRIGELVAILKEQKGYNYKDKMNNGIFARSIGIDPSQFSKVKTGEISVTLKQILEISSIYGVRAGWIIKGEMPVFEHEIDINVAKSELSVNISLSGKKQEIEEIKLSLSRLLKVANASQDQDQPGAPIPQPQLQDTRKKLFPVPDRKKQRDNHSEKGK